MTLTPAQSVEICRKRGLSASDAVAILRLAQTPEEAETFADSFADPKPPQLTRADLVGMDPAEIESARIDGRCADIMDGKS